jgi:hypothetical protein
MVINTSRAKPEGAVGNYFCKINRIITYNIRAAMCKIQSSAKLTSFCESFLTVKQAFKDFSTHWPKRQPDNKSGIVL